MIDVTAMRTIPAEPQAIWPLLDEPGRLGEWFAFADGGEVIEGAGVGRRQRMHGHWGRKRSEIDQVIVEHEPPRRLAWRHEGERLDGRPAPRFAAQTVFTATLEPVDGGTRVTLHSAQVPASALRGAVIRVFGRREIGQKLRESLEAPRRVGAARLGECGGRVLDDDAGEPVQADDLDDAPDLRLRAADADQPPGPAQSASDDREVEQERAVREGQVAQVHDQIALGRQRAREGPAAPPPRRDVLVSRAAQ